MIDLPPDHLETVQRILAEHMPECEVRAFGSRVQWTAKDHSDLDLALVGKEKIDRRHMNRLEEAFEESDLPIRVDVLDWWAISDSFREVIEKGFEAIQPSIPGNTHRVGTESWNLTTLGNISQGPQGFVDGPLGSNLPASLYKPTGIPVIRGSNLSVGLDRFKEYDFVYVGQDTLNGLQRSEAQPEDIIFTKKGTIGQTGFVPLYPYKQYLISSNQIRLRVNRKVAEPLFVYYYVSSLDSIAKILRDSDATGVPKTNLDYFRSFPISMPSLDAQKGIIQSLSSLDDKVELNRRMNETLEAMARAIFKSWFVDFDPVRAKAEGRQPEGMDPATAALFPDSFEDSELGEIPRGWSVKDVGEVLELAYGKSLPQKSRQPGPYPVYGSGGVGGYHNTALVSGPGIVVGRRGTVGSLHWVYEDFFPIDTTFYVKSRSDRMNLRWLFYMLSTINFISLGADSAVPGVNRNSVYAQRWCVPPEEAMIVAFGKTMTSLISLMNGTSKENIVLTKLRNTLLPKLISGEIRVKDAEAMIGGKK